MSGTHWIVEGRIDPRWPINTRGNIGEVFPEVLTPLSYELGVKPAEAGWREAYSMMGIADRRDFDSTEPPVIIGLYGGYGYLNLSYLRMLGVRAPGSSPAAIDVAFFGEGNPPPYEPKPGDKRRVATIRILRIVLKALSQKSMPEPGGRQRTRRRRVGREAARPGDGDRRRAPPIPPRLPAGVQAGLPQPHDHHWHGRHRVRCAVRRRYVSRTPGPRHRTARSRRRGGVGAVQPGPVEGRPGRAAHPARRRRVRRRASRASPTVSRSSPPPTSSAPSSPRSSAATATAARTTGSCHRGRGRTRPSSPTWRSSACATAPTTCHRRRGSPATTPAASTPRRR